MNELDRVFFLRERSVAEAHAHAAQADGGDFEAVAEFALFHGDDFLFLNIQPIRQLQVDGPEPGFKVAGVIVVIIHQVQVRQRRKAPLQARVDPQVVALVTVLD